MLHKKAKEEVNFESPAKGPDHCGQCTHYRPLSRRCNIVAGAIGPGDWCKLFKEKVNWTRR